jgi:LysM repeat protein
VERICPYLALAEDGRTVADGFDPEHLCHALTPPAELDRARQVQLCLTEAHVRCDRFAAARTAWLAASSGLPRVAADVAFGRTRLILEPEPAWRGRSGASAPPGRRAILLAAAGAAIVLVLAFAGLSGMLGGAPAADGSGSPEPSATATPPPSEAPASSPAEPSPSVATTPTVSPAPTPTPAPTPRTYVVQSGDTLNGIAQRFGTTAAAIAAVNGINVNDTIDPGDVLIIP